MDNKEVEKNGQIDKSTKSQIKKYSYGKYLLVFMFLGAIFNTLQQNIKPHSLSAFSAFAITFVQIILDTSVLYFLVLWVIDLIRRRRNRPENKKVKLVVNIIFAALFLLMIISVFMVLSNKNETKIDFKNLSSEQIINSINKLSQKQQLIAYKQHSELGKQVGEIWTENLKSENQNFDTAFQKTLPILISNGWNEESARDFLQWMTSKSLVILLRDPEGWCTGNDCRIHTDSEIRETLREDKTLSETVIFGIFQELRVDEGLSPLPELPKL
jgi:amino acid transporter